MIDSTARKSQCHKHIQKQFILITNSPVNKLKPKEFQP